MKIFKNKWFARFFLLIGIAVYMLTGFYFESASLPSHYDPLLNLIPVINVNLPVLIGLVFLYIFAIMSLIPLWNSKEETELFIIFGLFLIIRSILCLTASFGPPEGYLVVKNSLLHKIGLLFHKDFFFSGHTSAPFLFFLFFKGKIQKTIFLLGTFLMGIGVLLMHHHYVVDVLAAPIIIWAIYSFSKKYLLKENF